MPTRRPQTFTPQLSDPDLTLVALDGADGTRHAIWDQPADPDVSVKINIQRSDHRVAPEGMLFDLQLSGFDIDSGSDATGYEPAYHDKAVFWDYGESYRFRAPTNVLAMDAADGGNRTDSRYSRGPLGAHTFRTPGRYTVRVAVLEPASGKLGFGSVDIGVADPEEFYAETRTLFVDTTGKFDNAPDRAQTFTSLVEAFAALKAALTPHRIVLERAQVHIQTESLDYRAPAEATGTGLRIEARAGTGAKPVIQIGRAWIPHPNLPSDTFLVDQGLRRTSGATSGTVLQNLDLRGLWKSSNESGRQIDCLRVEGVGYGASSVLIDACDFTGWQTGILPSTFPKGATGRVMTLNDCTMTNWGNFGVLDTSQSSQVFSGCRLMQNPGALAGSAKGSNRDNASNRHGPIRLSAPEKTVIEACDLFSSTGWADWGNGPIRAIQAAVRWGTSPKFTGARLNMQSNAIESAWTPLLLLVQNTREPRELANALVEGNILVAGFQSRAAVECSFGGTTLRNNIMIFADTERDSQSIGGINNSRIKGGFLWLSGGAPGNPDNERTPVRFYNNTLINLHNSAAPEVTNSLNIRPVTVRNNLIHQPNLGRPDTRFAPLNSALAFKTRYIGYQDIGRSLITRFATPRDSAQIWAPKAGSDALGAALSEPNAGVDFRGNLRPEPPSLGALEAD